MALEEGRRQEEIDQLALTMQYLKDDNAFAKPVKGRATLDYKTYKSYTSIGKITKLNHRNVQLYQIGIKDTDIPKLKMKHLKYKDYMYMDQMYFSTEGEYTGIEMNLTGVIHIAHGVADAETMNYPYTPENILWEPIRKECGSWIFNEHKQREEKPVPMHIYRSNLLKDIKLSRPGGKGDICSYLSKYCAPTQTGLYSKCCRGVFDLPNMIFLKCNKCAAMLAFPNMLHKDYVDMNYDTGQIDYLKRITKRNVCDIIEAIENFPTLGEYNWKSATMNEGMASMLEWMIAYGSANCYNCGWHISVSAEIKPDFFLMEAPVYGDYGINAMTLEEFKVCLNLDTPPPAELKQARQLHDKFSNAEITRVLSKMQTTHINTFHNVNLLNNSVPENIDEIMRFSTSQRLMETTLTDIEVQEICMLVELSQLTNGDITYHPSSLNVFHGLYDFIGCIGDSSWFQTTGITLNSVDSIRTLPILSASMGIEINNLEPGMMILHLNTIGDKVWNRANDNYYTATSLSSVPVEWNATVCETLSRNTHLQIDNELYDLITIKSTRNLMITYVNDKYTFLNPRIIRGKTKIRALLPTVDLNSLGQTLGIIGTKWVEQELDTELIYRLMINGITGKKSVESLLTYVSGLTATRYSVGGQLIDLTNISIKDGIPELLYVIMILTNNKATTQWASIMYKGLNAHDLAKTFYDVLLGKALIILKNVNESAYNALNEFMTAKPLVAFARDTSILKHAAQTDLNTVLPYYIIESACVRCHAMGTKLCNHHSSDCEHDGDNMCKCCGVQTSNEKLCDCCLAIDKESEFHRCGHKCAKDNIHMCNTLKTAGFCTHNNRCVCCGNKVCGDYCKCCFDAEVVEEVEVKRYEQKYKNLTGKSKSGKKPEQEIKPDKPKEQKDKHASMLKQILLNNERVILKSVQKLLAEDLFHTNIENEMHCFYMPVHGSRTLSVLPLTLQDVVDRINEDTNCLLHCISKQTSLSMSDLSSIVGYKTSHNISDAIDICKYFNLNAIVQTDQNTATLIRYGRMTEKYILIAHVDAITSLDMTLHWVIPNTIVLKTLPYGYWLNMDISGLSIPNNIFVDTFYVDEGTFNDSKERLQEFLRASLLTGIQTVRDVEVWNDDLCKITNSEEDVPLQGKYNFSIPTELAELATEVFNNDLFTGAIMATTSFVSSADDIRDMIIEEMKNMLRSIAMFKYKMRKYDNEGDNVFVVSEATTKFFLPKELKLWKSLDYIMLESTNGEKEWTLTMKNMSQSLITNKFGQDLKRIYVPKQSYSSMLRSLRALVMAYDNLKNFSTMEIKQIVDGVPGAGKSHYIKNNLNIEDSTFVCKFSRAKQAMEEVIENTYTWENLAMRKKQIDKLIVDEAGAMSVMELVALCNVPNMKVWAFGDLNQITTTDFSSTPGIREDVNVLSYFREYLQTWSETNRYGSPMVEDIVRLSYPNVSKSKRVTWNTSHSVVHVKDTDELMTKLRVSNHDLVMCFHKQMEVLISNKVKTNTATENHPRKIARVHADQGIEGDDVAVIYYDLEGNTSPTGILSKLKYLITAVTRCRTNVTMYTNYKTIESIPEAIMHATMGSSNVKVLDPINLCLNKELSILEQELLKVSIEERFDSISSIEMSEDKVIVRGKVKGFNIAFKTTSYNTVGLDMMTRSFISMYKTIFSKIFRDINDNIEISLTSTDSETTRIDTQLTLESSDASSMNSFFTAVENEDDAIGMELIVDTQDIAPTVTQFNSVMTFKLTKTIWKNLIMIADASLLNQRANTGLVLSTPMGNVEVKIFNGCSLFCGFKFNIGEDVVYISSAHTENEEDTVTLLSSQVRAFAGNKSTVRCLVKFLADQQSTYIPAMSESSLIRRILERVKTVLKTKTINISGANKDAGMFYKAVNDDYYDTFTKTTGKSQNRITHQLVTKLLIHTEFGVQIYPTMKLMRTLNDVMKEQRGIMATNVSVMSSKNISLMDNIMSKKVIAVETERKLITVSVQSWKTWGFSLMDVINERNVIQVRTAPMIDNVNTIINPLALSFLSKMLQIKEVDVSGVDALSVSLQNNHNYRLDVRYLTTIEHLHLLNSTKTILNGLRQNYEKSSGVEKDRLKELVMKMESNGAFGRDGKLFETLFVGLVSSTKMFNQSQYKEIYTIKINNYNEAFIKKDDGVYVAGTNGFKIKEWWRKKNYIEINNFGLFSLIKINVSSNMNVMWDNYEINNVRRFVIENTDLPMVCIPDVIFRKLIARAMIEDVSITDMLSYCKSMASTVVYTQKGYYRRYNLKYDELHLYCMVAMNIAERHRKFFKSISRLTGMQEEQSIVTMLRNKMLSAVQSLLTTHDIPQLFTSYMSWLNDKFEESDITKTLKDMVMDKHILEIQPRTIMIYRNNSNDGKGNDTSIDDDGDESESENGSNNGENRNNNEQPGSNSNNGGEFGGNNDNNENDNTKGGDGNNKPHKGDYKGNQNEDEVGNNTKTDKNDSDANTLKPKNRTAWDDDLDEEEIIDSEIGIAAIKIIGNFIMKRINRKRLKLIDPHDINCPHCHKFPRSQYVKINNVARRMFHIFNNYARENNLNYTLCRGSVLAAMYYGQVVYFNSEGFSHWVDGDIDIAIFTNSKKPTMGLHKIHTDLAKLLGVQGMYRAGNQIGAYLWYNKYPLVDMRKNPKVHPHHEARDKIMRHFCLDVAIVYCNERGVHINSKHLSEQLGLKEGIYDPLALVPTNSKTVEFYGEMINMPPFWWATLTYTANVYKNGNFKDLMYPWYPGLKTAGSAVCENYVVPDNWQEVFFTHLRMNGAPMYDWMNSMSKSDFKPIPRVKINVAIVFAGSQGDIIPMRCWYGVISEFATITVYKPADIEVKHSGNTIDYIDTYKSMVHGNRNKTVAQGIVQQLSNMSGEYDYIVAPHFAREAMLLKARKFIIWVHPLIVKVDKGWFKIITKLVGMLTLNTNKSRKVSSIWTGLGESEYENVGMPLHRSLFEPSDNDIKLIALCTSKDIKFTLITFGSMGVKEYSKLLQKCLDSCSGLVVIVRGYTKAPITVHYDDKTHSIGAEKWSNSLIVLNSLNYYIMGPYTSRVICHGGAGTLQTFLTQGVVPEVLPQAYDQFDNAKWLNTYTPGKLLNKDTEYDLFRNNVAKLFGARVKQDYLDTCDLDIPCDEIEPKQPNFRIVYSSRECQITNNIRSSMDCILLSAEVIYKNDIRTYNQFKHKYNTFTETRPVQTIQDLLFICISANCSAVVHDGENNDVYELYGKSKKPTECFTIVNQGQHCSVGEVGNKIPQEQSKDYIENIWPTNNFDQLVLLLREFLQLFKTNKPSNNVLNIADEKTVLASLRVNWRQRYTTLMRVSSPIITIKSTGRLGYNLVEGTRIQPWTLYECISNRGLYTAVCIKVSGMDHCLLYHGLNNKLKINCVVKLHSLKNLSTTTKYSHGLVSKITAINNTTLTQCHKAGLPVQVVCSLSATKCYIYSTWNRYHHLEKERECILSSRELAFVTRQMTRDEEKSIRTMTVPRCAVAKEELIYCIEPDPEDETQITREVLELTVDMNKFKSANIWYTKNAEKAELLKRMFKESESKKTHLYSRIHDAEFEENMTLQELMSKVKLELEFYIFKELGEKLNMEVVNANNIHLRKVKDVKFTIEQRWQAIRAEFAYIHPYILLAPNAFVYEISKEGAGVVKDEVQLWNEVEYKMGDKLENKFVEKGIESNININVKSVTALNLLSSGDNALCREVAPELLHTSRIVEVHNAEAAIVDIEDSKLDDLPTARTIDFWDQMDELQDNIVHLPTNNVFKIRSRLEPANVTIGKKMRMEDYPEIARPSLTFMLNSTLNSVSTRQGAVEEYVKRSVIVSEELEMLKQNYFRMDWVQMSEYFKQNQITITEEDTMNWVKEHNYPQDVMKSLNELFDQGFEFNPINAARVHGKVEQTTKLDKVGRWFTDVFTRSIIASAYCISALFSPVFLKIKKRFKDMLHDKIVYADSLAPSQLNAKAKTYGPAEWVVEDDLSKQDAATKDFIINIEFLIYDMLGLDEGVNIIYKWIHSKWKWKAAGLSGVGDAMRLTGQPTTSIGNTITNMIVHNRFLMRNYNLIKLMCLLGDDNIMFAVKELNVKNHGTETKELYNIKSKIKQKKYVGEFLSMIVHTFNGYIEFCPNYPRMRHKFSVCNYVFQQDEREEKLKQRRLSYCLMLGNIKRAKTFVLENFSTGVQDWYNVMDAIEANMLYHNVDEGTIHNNIGKLLNLMERGAIMSKTPTWTTDNNRKTVRIDKVTLHQNLM